MQTKKKQPVLTIGIIFKNEIRCLERCLKSLLPLRETLCCELIMADTGSDDGSYKIASRYADTLFGFTWTDDFSAARNAIMDKASGQWYMTIDADEYLDGDVEELVNFFQTRDAEVKQGCTVIQRNYETYEMDQQYSDFMAMRLVRMSTGLRYRGAIHESWHFTSGNQSIKNFSRTILHHDGYVHLNEEQGRGKRERNLALIKKDLAKDPDSLRNLLQYLESGVREEDYTDILRHAASLVEKKQETWELLGPSIFRYAVQEAKAQGLDELDEWIERARNWFPQSFFTRVDVEYIAFTHNWEHKNYAACICGGKRYLKALTDYRAGRGDLAGMMYGSFYYGSSCCEQSLIVYMADAYIKEKKPQCAAEILEELDCTAIQPDSVENLMRVLWRLQVDGGTDTAPALLHFFEEGQKPLPDKKSAKKRMDTFYQTALHIFMLRKENGKETIMAGSGSPSYTLFLPLEDKCELGLAARLMEEKNIENIRRLLLKVQRWDRFPIEALSYAIRCKVPFPLPESPLKLEEINKLSTRLAADQKNFFSIIKDMSEKNSFGNMQTLIWNERLVMLAIQIHNWKKENVPQNGAVSCDTDEKMILARLFARLENEFLMNYYTANVLQEENIFVLPTMHRFGWYCVQAFDALDAGNLTEYVHNLKSGLETCENMTAMVEYLIKYTPQLSGKDADIPAELLALAKQVKKILSAYPPNDPAVTEIKASPMYQKVAWIIENESEDNI